MSVVIFVFDRIFVRKGDRTEIIFFNKACPQTLCEHTMSKLNYLKAHTMGVYTHRK